VDFPVVRMNDCPLIETDIMQSEMHSQGVGEPGVPPIAPTVANAVLALTGQRLRMLLLRVKSAEKYDDALAREQRNQKLRPSQPKGQKREGKEASIESFNINSRAVAVQAESDMPLLWLLRCELAMTGTEFGRGVGICGACTIHL
jgi:isoquinoline 1-oxidoreductase beta subunit